MCSSSCFISYELRREAWRIELHAFLTVSIRYCITGLGITYFDKSKQHKQYKQEIWFRFPFRFVSSHRQRHTIIELGYAYSIPEQSEERRFITMWFYYFCCRNFAIKNRVLRLANTPFVRGRDLDTRCVPSANPSPVIFLDTFFDPPGSSPLIQNNADIAQ